MNDVKVSVIVATYRREADLIRALRSLAVQSYRNLEILLVDDNDDLEWNEKVRRIAEDFQKQNKECPLVYIQNHPNKGSAETRNIGIRASSGTYITFLDDDDEYLADKIKTQVEQMESQGLDYSITDLALYFEDGRLSERRVRDYIMDTSKEALLRYHLMHHMTGTDTLMFREEYLKRIGGFAPIDVGDEFYLMLRAIMGDGSFGYLNRCDLKAYVHTGEDGLSSGQSKIDGENALYEYKKTMFDQIDGKTRRYIKMRHHAVLAFAYLRMKKPWKFFLAGIQSFLNGPGESIKLITNRG